MVATGKKCESCGNPLPSSDWMIVRFMQTKCSECMSKSPGLMVEPLVPGDYGYEEDDLDPWE